VRFGPTIEATDPRREQRVYESHLIVYVHRRFLQQTCLAFRNKQLRLKCFRIPFQDHLQTISNDIFVTLTNPDRWKKLRDSCEIRTHDLSYRSTKGTARGWIPFDLIFAQEFPATNVPSMCYIQGAKSSSDNVKWCRLLRVYISHSLL